MELAIFELARLVVKEGRGSPHGMTQWRGCVGQRHGVV